jgi:basic membrane protein A
MNSFIRAVRTLGITDNYVGIDGDMTDDRSFCLFSTVKHVDTVLIDYIGLWLNGAMPKHQLFGLADGTTEVIRGEYAYKALGNGVQLEDVVDLDSLRQVAIGKEEERYGK